MRVKIKALIILLLCTVVYFACQKPVKSTDQANNSAIGAQLAATLYKSITGVYGGNNVGNGIKATYQVSPNSRGPRINSITTSSCGNALDTILNYNIMAHDTTQTYLQHIKYALICNGVTPIGYNTTDSVGITTSSALALNNITVLQYYRVQALDTTYKYVSMDGGIANNTSFSTLNSAKAVTEYHKINSYYTLEGLRVNVSAGISVITTGVSNFTAVQSDLSSGTPAGGTVVNYVGSITFLGNNMAKITFTINGGTPLSYMVNVITGVSTPI